jgi:hypothetical protein
MAARITKGTKDVPWDERTRQRIKTSMLVNRLSDHVLGDASMSATQIRAAEILLNKTLANLTATELVGSVATYVARLPEPSPDAASWLASVNVPLLPPIEAQPIDIASVSDATATEVDDKQGGE